MAIKRTNLCEFKTFFPYYSTQQKRNKKVFVNANVNKEKLCPKINDTWFLLLFLVFLFEIFFIENVPT